MRMFTVNQHWFASNVKCGDAVSFTYNGLKRKGRVVEILGRYRDKGYMTLEYTPEREDYEDVNGKISSKFKRFKWTAMDSCMIEYVTDKTSDGYNYPKLSWA